MNKEEIIATLKKIIQPYVQDAEGLNHLNENTNFISDLKINSANLVDIILDVEDEFDITIEDDAMESMLTVGSAMKIIEAKIASK